MRTLKRFAALICLLAAICVSAAQDSELPKVLFFANPMTSDNDVIRRPSPEVLSVAERYFSEISKGIFDVTITQDGSEISRENLARYKAVVFFTAINPPGVDREGLIEWVNQGGAFIGIHSTANTFQNFPPFGEMLGAYYDRRPWRTKENLQTKARVKVEDKTHPATQHLGESFEIVDDLYQFKNFDRSRVQLLLRLDPASLDLTNSRVNQEDKDLPIAWAKRHGKGRVFYTALGDWEPTWKDPKYRTHLIKGIQWAMGTIR
jgi:uncharacterized protein